MIREIVRCPISGWPVVALLIPIQLALVALVVLGAVTRSPALAATGILGFLLGAFLLAGLFMVNPNEARVLQLFGDYKGSAREPGLRWANPLYAKRPVSLRVVSFESGKLKVNDLDGNPVEIAAIVLWRVVDSAEAAFEVSDCAEYVRVQSESALRNLATRYLYDAHDEQTVSRAAPPAACRATSSTRCRSAWPRPAWRS